MWCWSIVPLLGLYEYFCYSSDGPGVKNQNVAVAHGRDKAIAAVDRPAYAYQVSAPLERKAQGL